MSEEIKHEELDEVKASYGVNAEVPDPKTKKAKAPGGDGKAAGHDEAPTAVKPVKPAEVKVTKEDVDVSEDIAAIFGGQDLSEDFVSRATDIFEAAVVAKVNEVLESKQLDLDAELEATAEEMVEGLSDRLDQYLEYVAEEWMEENKLAVEQGIRAEIAENFLKGLHSLFQESYIDVPEEKADLVDELAAKLEEVHESMNHEIERSIALHEELVEMKKQIAFAGVIDGLA
jgi:DNA mismatch repair ATPase MutS